MLLWYEGLLLLRMAGGVYIQEQVLTFRSDNLYSVGNQRDDTCAGKRSLILALKINQIVFVYLI